MHIGFAQTLKLLDGAVVLLIEVQDLQERFIGGLDLIQRMLGDLGQLKQESNLLDRFNVHIRLVA